MGQVNNWVSLEEAMIKTLIIAAITCFGLVIILSGCSKDKKVNPGRSEGDYQNQSYLEAKNYATIYLDSMITGITDGFALRTFDGASPLKALSDSASIVYDSSSFWWAIYSNSINGDTNAVHSDSIRFELGDLFSRLPDSFATTGIDNRVKTAFNITLDTSSYASEFTRDVHLTGIQGDQVTIKIVSSAHVDLLLGQSAYGQTYTDSMTNIIFNKSDLENELVPNPISGSMALGMLINASTSDGTSNVAWTITITFRVDGYDAHAESGNNYWDWQVNYNG